MKEKPNILLFFTDDQRFDTLRALGNGQIHTPNLDALVARGTAFTHAHIQGGTTAAVCMPSRGMLHTGRGLFHLQGQGEEIPEDHTTIGECLRHAGYTTFGTGKWHNGTAAYARSFSCGDEIFFGGMADHWNVPACHFDPTGKYPQRAAQIHDPFHSRDLKYNTCDHIHPGVHSTDLFQDTSMRFLKGHDKRSPFFMYVSLMAPHDPRSMPREFLDLYDPDSINLPDNFLPEHPIDTGALRVRDEQLAAFPRDPQEIKQHIAEYYAMISHLDHAFGQIVETLKETGQYDNTIIVVAGDNGLALGQHGLMGKQCLYDHSARVPLVFAGPGIPEGQRCDSLAYLLDIFPTLCDLTGVATPASVTGQSLATCFTEPKTQVRDSVYLAYTDAIRGLSNKKEKLIEYAGGETQLFDLVNDPLEKHNLAESAEAQPRLAVLRKQLRELAETWDDENHPHGRAFWTKREDIK